MGIGNLRDSGYAKLQSDNFVSSQPKTHSELGKKKWWMYNSTPKQFLSTSTRIDPEMSQLIHIINAMMEK